MYFLGFIIPMETDGVFRGKKELIMGVRYASLFLIHTHTQHTITTGYFSTGLQGKGPKFKLRVLFILYRKMSMKLDKMYGTAFFFVNSGLVS